MLSEPPGADPHAGWCGRGQGEPGLYPIRRAAARRPPRASAAPASRRRSYFSILARKALTPGHFNDTDELADRILGFQTEFAKTATRFNRTFTRADLHALLDRLDQRGRLTPAA
jgi:hypothetical protein